MISTIGGSSGGSVIQLGANSSGVPSGIIGAGMTNGSSLSVDSPALGPIGGGRGILDRGDPATDLPNLTGLGLAGYDNRGDRDRDFNISDRDRVSPRDFSMQHNGGRPAGYSSGGMRDDLDYLHPQQV
jgi:hypothetical protein